jgi:hypothetical protein
MPNFSGMWTTTQQMQAKGQSIWPDPPPSVIGQAFGGGYYAGQIGVSGTATHYLIVGPASSTDSAKKWKDANTATTGADSVINGPQNTADMVADGNSTVYPCAHFCNDLVVGGFSDWYMPALNELEICFYNLKPSTQNNVTTTGANANAVPVRASNYTTGIPAQTSAVAFQNGGSEQFANSTSYWSSTEASSTDAWFKIFGAGNLYQYSKNVAYRVRAIRRVAV